MIFARRHLSTPAITMSANGAYQKLARDVYRRRAAAAGLLASLRLSPCRPTAPAMPPNEIGRGDMKMMRSLCYETRIVLGGHDGLETNKQASIASASDAP